MVGVDEPRLEVVQRAHDDRAAAAARGERGADAVVEGDRPAAVADLVGHERHRGEHVERRVEHGALRPGGLVAGERERGGGEPPGVDEHDDVAVLLDAVLVAHRPPEPRGRPPVDLAHVVVGQVVADELEVRAQPERAARGDALLAEAALADGARDPPRHREVGVDGDLRGRAGAVVPGREAERAARARRRRRELVAAAAAGGSVASSAPSASRGASSRSGGAAWRMRTVVPAAGGVARARSAAGRRGRAPAAPRPRAAARRGPRARRRASATRRATAASAGERRGERGEEGDQRGRGGGARRRAHRGTGTASSAPRTASAGV